MEEETHQQLPFLDILLHRCQQSIATSVYHKPTHTHQYIHHQSNHHPQIKKGIVATLARRAKAVCSPDSLHSELKHLKSTFQDLNEYPLHLVSSTITKTLKETPKSTKPEPSPIRINIPYHGQIRHRISRYNKKTTEIDVTFRNDTNLKTLLSANGRGPTIPKCNNPAECIYQIQCSYEKQNVPETSTKHKADQEETLAAPLHDACGKGNLTKVKSILSQGLVNVNSRDGNHGKTPLMVAAQEGHCRIFDFLIKKGANKSEVDNNGKNILHWACKGGHEGLVKCILPQYDVDINNKYIFPLMQAAIRGYRDVFEFLVCMGANVSQVDSKGNSVLHWSCRGGHVDIVKYLLSLCSLDNLINSRGIKGDTPLMVAAYAGHKDVFEILVGKGANVSQVDNTGNNVLHYSILGDNVDLVKHIIRANMVNLKDRNKSGQTAAMIASIVNNGQLYNLLVSRGCPGK
ncbi:inversin-like [Haliotis asinina]|uniref:inversin-like n=1 Tax=Haliotis asinina TaxID=109174 RepID=UPI003531AF66